MTDRAEDGESGFAGVDEHAARTNSQNRGTPQHNATADRRAVSSVMVRASVILLILVAPAAAAPRVEPHAPLAFEAAFGGFGMDEADVEVSTMGAELELAVGHGRWQYFVSGFAGLAQAERARTWNDGFALRPGLGARYVARSFAFGTDAALELGIEASVGTQLI